MIRIFIPTHDRATTATTPQLLAKEGLDFLLVVRPGQSRQYLANPFYRDRKRQFAVVDADNGQHGIHTSREACRSALDLGEWCLQLDDNIRGFTAAEPAFYKNYVDPEDNPTRAEFEHLFNVKVSFATLYEQVLLDSIREAERRGANLVAFSAFENPFFRRLKWRDCGYSQNKMILLRKTALHWDQSENHSTMEEYSLGAAMHLEYGRILINNLAHPIAGHYEPGGLGPYAERLPAKIDACINIKQRWPGFFRESQKKSADPRGELLPRFHTLGQVEQWRGEMKEAGLDPNYRDTLA